MDINNSTIKREKNRKQQRYYYLIFLFMKIQWFFFLSPYSFLYELERFIPKILFQVLKMILKEIDWLIFHKVLRDKNLLKI